MKWLKKWSYLLLWTGVGIVYLACVDKWQVYAEPLMQVRNWYYGSDISGEQSLLASGGAVSSPAAEGTGMDPEVQISDNSEENGDLSGGGVSGKDAETGGAPGGENPGGNTETENPSDGQKPSGNTGTENPAGGQTPGGNTEAGNPAGGETPGGNIGTGETGNPWDWMPGEPGGENGEPAYMTVEDDYFSDAVFIGDSRTVGMFEYGGLEETAAFYASTGLTVYKLFDSEIVSVPGERKKISVEQALQQNTFAKIYLMIGINEMGTGTVESFLEKYQEAVDHLRELQPDAIIYLQGIIKVTTERSAQGDYINNEGIEARNEGIAQMADNEKVFYLDVNPLICDETGGMEASYTFDGVHLKAKYIEIWKDYLKTHAIFS